MHIRCDRCGYESGAEQQHCMQCGNPLFGGNVDSIALLMEYIYRGQFGLAVALIMDQKARGPIAPAIQDRKQAIFDAVMRYLSGVRGELIPLKERNYLVTIFDYAKAFQKTDPLLQPMAELGTVVQELFPYEAQSAFDHLINGFYYHVFGEIYRKRWVASRGNPDGIGVRDEEAFQRWNYFLNTAILAYNRSLQFTDLSPHWREFVGKSINDVMTQIRLQVMA